MKKIFTLLLFLGISVFGQTQYDWRDVASNGDWQVQNHWWNGTTTAIPGGGEILFFNNNVQTTGWNNLSATNRHRIRFGSSASVSRYLNGETINTFYDFGGVRPYIQNNSVTYHKVNFPFNVGYSGGMELNPVDGDLEIGQAVSNGGFSVYIFGNNSKLITFSGVLSGTGKLILEQYSKVNIISASTFTGDVEVNSGEFWVGTNGTLGSGTIKVGNTSTSNTTKLYTSNSSVTISRAITVGNGNTSTRFIGGIQTSGTSIFSSNIDLSAQTTNETNFDAVNAGTIVEFSGIISGSNSPVKKIGAGTIVFSGNNTYSGATNVNEGKLIVQGSGTTGSGALTIASGATLESSVSLSNSSITVNGTFNVVEDMTVNDLTLNSGGSISIAAGKTLTIAAGKTLTLNTKLTLGSGNLALSPTSIVSSSSSNYIIATGTGKLRKLFADGSDALSAFTFPVGDADNYSPVEITLNSGTRTNAYIESNLKATAHPEKNDAAALYLNRYWTVSQSGITSPNYNIVITYVDADISVPASEGSLVLGKWDGSVWTKPTSTLNSTANTITSNNLLSFSDFTGGEAGALPVELTSFNAALRNGMVDLKWETKTEINNYGFEIERKSATADWTKIGFVEGHGSTNSPKYYSYSDKPSGTGKISYRLKQIDNDGQFEYSPVVEVLVDNLPNGFVLEQNYPNPFNPETSIRFALKEDTKASLKVFNTMGQEVATLFDGIAEAGRYYNVKFSSNELSSGFYIYKLVAGDFVSVKKMLLMK